MAAGSGGSSSLGLSGTLHQTQTATCYSFIIYFFAAPALIRCISAEGEAADERAGLNICLQLIAALARIHVLLFFFPSYFFPGEVLRCCIDVKVMLRRMFVIDLLGGGKGRTVCVDVSPDSRQQVKPPQVLIVSILFFCTYTFF